MRTRLPVWSFLAWTCFVWISRMRNVVADDDLSSDAMVWRLAVAVAFVGLAVTVVGARLRGAGRANAALGLLVAVTVGWWSIRGVAIVLDDHDLGFTIVHTALMIVSIGLAMWAWLRRDG